MSDESTITGQYPTLEEATAFAKDIFGVNLPTMDVLPYQSDLEWMRKHGEHFEHVELLPFGKEKQCYVNASKYLDYIDSEAQYVQGWVMFPSGVIFGHAWIVDSEGIAREVTWPENAGCTYFGARISDTELTALKSHRGAYDWYVGIAQVLAPYRERKNLGR